MLVSYRKETIEQIRTLNGKLRLFINSPRQTNSASFIRDTPENVSKATLTKAVQHYKRIQEHAVTLDKILHENLQPPVCACTSQHHAHLQLDLLSTSALSKPRAQLSFSKPNVRFRVMFSEEDLRRKPDMWKELELEHIDSSEAACLKNASALPLSCRANSKMDFIGKYALRYANHLVDAVSRMLM